MHIRVFGRTSRFPLPGILLGPEWQVSFPCRAHPAMGSGTPHILGITSPCSPPLLLALLLTAALWCAVLSSEYRGPIPAPSLLCPVSHAVYFVCFHNPGYESSRAQQGKWVVGSLATKSHPTLVNPWTVAHEVPLSMGFSRQEYWSALPFPPPGNLPDPGIEPRSPALQADSLPTEPE